MSKYNSDDPMVVLLQVLTDKLTDKDQDVVQAEYQKTLAYQNCDRLQQELDDLQRQTDATINQMGQEIAQLNTRRVHSVPMYTPTPLSFYLQDLTAFSIAGGYMNSVDVSDYVSNYGRKIFHIKEVRDRTRWDLKACKDYVEAYITSHRPYCSGDDDAEPVYTIQELREKVI